MRPIILLAQEVSLQQLIGASMFEFLLAAKQVGGGFDASITGNSVWSAFTDDHMKPTLYAYVVQEFFDSNAVHLSEVGITQTEGETGKKAERDELKYQREQAQFKANFYANRLRNFICDSRYWPTFSTYFGDSQQNLFPEQRINKGGLWFPKSGMPWSRYRKRDI